MMANKRIFNILKGLAIFKCFIILTYADKDPCKPGNYEILNDWRRSVALPSGNVCDNLLEEAWYRITSGAGENMPTECVDSGSRCSTRDTIWLSKDGVQPSEDIYPKEGDPPVTRTAYSSTFDGNCRNTQIQIKIKRCTDFLVYYLKPTHKCPSAYCFGDQVRCVNGTSSESGFGPDCYKYPEIQLSKPYVITDLHETEAINKFGKPMVYSRVYFDCKSNGLDANYTYDITWFINDVKIQDVKIKSLTVDDLNHGKGFLLEEHWTNLYRPNMLVRCGIQAGGNGFNASTPIQKSDNFFAGIKIEQTVDKDFIVKEKENLKIPVILTMPISCNWRKDMPTNVRNNTCLIVLLNGIPKYQADDKDKCAKGIDDDGVKFTSQYCGIRFNNLDWKTKKYIDVWGESDGMINKGKRLSFIRLYNPDNLVPPDDLLYWKNIHLPEIKVLIEDNDATTRGTACYSHNDPHMRTFDRRTYELQIRNGLTAGEYILFMHDKLPLQVNAYYKKCYGSILCNCGVAARSGNSLFVANFCDTEYQGQRKVNRYVINRLCDDHNLIVTESGNTYTVILPTGTKVTFSHGKISNFYGIHGINIIPSILDKGLTSGLCGRYNDDIKDDLTPRNFIHPVDVRTFAESWQVKNVTQEDTLFSPDGKLKDPVYHGQQYCSCKIPNKAYPHGEAIFSCDWTTASKRCRETSTKSSVFFASCTNKVLRNKRSSSLNNQFRRDKRGSEMIDEDEKPPMFVMAEEQDDSGIIPTETWQNGWTEINARKHCTDKFKIAPAFGPCSEHVPSVESSSYIESCILDIKASGGDAWLRATIDNFANACKQEAIRTEIFSTTNSTNSTGSEKSILSIIEEATCPGNCSGRGICSEGECHCYTHFSGDDCSADKNKPPLLETDAFEGECDSSQKACRRFIIPGYDFARNSLACKFVPFSVKKKENMTLITTGESFINPGTYRSSFFMLCELPAARRKRSIDIAIVATGFHISISNNGKDFTDQLSMLVYDSLCYSCNTTTFECKELITCPKKSKNEQEKNNVALHVGIAIGGVAAGVILVIVIIKVIKHLTKRTSSISDSTVMLNNSLSKEMTHDVSGYGRNEVVYLQGNK